MNIQIALSKVIDNISLTTDEMKTVMRQIMTGKADEAQIGAFLVALRMKSESIDEIVGAVSVMREMAEGVNIEDEYAVDIVGTGGDGANLFNVSTASAIVVAAAGGKVAKHGNRKVSSSTGSADVLEAAGVSLNLNSNQVERCVNELGVGFMFAPQHHSAMRHAIGARKSLGIRTLFNILGPMTNPAGVKRQLIGVFSQALCKPMAEVMQRMGSEHALFVHSQDGLDEISLAAPTHVCELKQGAIAEYVIEPEEFGIKSQTLQGLMVDSPQQSFELINDALGKREHASGKKAADMLALNSGAAIYVAGLANSMKSGVDMAEDAIYSGLAGEKLKQLVAFSNHVAEC